MIMLFISSYCYLYRYHLWLCCLCHVIINDVHAMSLSIMTIPSHNPKQTEQCFGRFLTLKKLSISNSSSWSSGLQIIRLWSGAPKSTSRSSFKVPKQMNWSSRPTRAKPTASVSGVHTTSHYCSYDYLPFPSSPPPPEARRSPGCTS